MPLKDFDNNSESIYDNERKYADFFYLFRHFFSEVEQREEVHRYYQSSFQSRE